MRVCFLGDISVAQPASAWQAGRALLPEVDLTIANLEGALVDAHTQNRLNGSKQIVLYNTRDVLDVLHSFDVQTVCLANNHLYDLPLPAAATCRILAQAGVASFGAGSRLSEANEPYVFTKEETTVQLFSFGWDVIGCKTAAPTREGVNPLTPEHVLDTIRQVRASDTDSFVAFIMHWNYELERYPQPAHRQLAHDLIRAGVDAVIGMHPHVAQGAEFVDGKPIVYSLGNWFLPPRRINHFTLVYPPISYRQLAFEIDLTGRIMHDLRFHWYQFNPAQNIIVPEQTEGCDGSILCALTPYADQSHTVYAAWFKAHRTRRHGLPIYVNYHHTHRNRFKDWLVGTRQLLIQHMVRWHLKGGLSSSRR